MAKCPYGKLKKPVGRRVCKKAPKRAPRRRKRLSPAEDARIYAALVAKYGDPERGLYTNPEDMARRRAMVASTPREVSNGRMYWDDGTVTLMPR